MFLGIEIQHVKYIILWLRPPLPLGHLYLAQIVRRIYISRLEPPRNLLRQHGSIVEAAEFFGGRRLLLCLKTSAIALIHQALETSVRGTRCYLLLKWVCEGWRSA